MTFRRAGPCALHRFSLTGYSRTKTTNGIAVAGRGNGEFIIVCRYAPHKGLAALNNWAAQWPGTSRALG